MVQTLVLAIALDQTRVRVRVPVRAVVAFPMVMMASLHTPAGTGLLRCLFAYLHTTSVYLSNNGLGPLFLGCWNPSSDPETPFFGFVV